MPNSEPNSQPHSNTQRLVRGAQQGDAPSFDQLYERLAPALCAWTTLRMRAIRGRVEVEDLLQEVWLRAHRTFLTFDTERVSFRAWLIGIAKNVLLEAMRKMRTLGRIQGADGVSARVAELAAVPEQVTSLTRRVARDDSLREFLASIESLPEEDRELFVYCGLEELSCVAVAKRLALAEATVRKRWQRLRARLQQSPPARALLTDLA